MTALMEQRHAGRGSFNIHECTFRVRAYFLNDGRRRFYMEYTMDTISRLVLGQRESRYFNNPRVEIVKNVCVINSASALNGASCRCSCAISIKLSFTSTLPSPPSDVSRGWRYKL